MTKKNIFEEHLNSFSSLKLLFQFLVCFFCKNCNPLKKVTPPFSQQPHSINENPVKASLPPPFLKIYEEVYSPIRASSKKEGVHTMYINKLAEKQEFSVFNQLCFILTLDFRFFLVCLKME